MPEWWGTREQITPRLEIEVKAMRAAFGKTFELVVPLSGLVCWRGTVQLNLTDIPHRDHVLRIVYPKRYPVYPPKAFVDVPVIVDAENQYEDGSLSLFNPRDGIEYGWNPMSSTAVTLTGWSIQWLYCYYVWELTGEWPSAG